MSRPSPLPRRFEAVPFATADALAAGVTPRRLRSVTLAAPHRGVRVDARHLHTLRERCSALAVVMTDGQAFTGPTAAILLGLPLPLRLERDPLLHVVALDGRRAPRRRGVVASRSSARPRLVGVAGVRGARLTAPADTWCSLAVYLGLDDLIAAGERLIGLPAPLADERTIDEAIRRHGSRRGAGKLAEARGAMQANVYSRRETFARLGLTRAGLPEPEPNGPIMLRSGRRTRGDLVFREYKVLVEYDGEQHLFDVDQWATDVARFNDLVDDGWWVIRITKATPRAELIARTARALVERGWTGTLPVSR
ncbi:hypothetical protein BJY17_003011 [Agromyces hippuratus]|uniref:DUF559 domain-containing protein n=1 Tax=Agromyces hippuratus TaxID=286438 RepID=A0A852X434_9MICO|nr:hypothetical protein [Agromyces hippuratus]NYG22264.1 hypothetical protein [Agromyces hippuratus]